MEKRTIAQVIVEVLQAVQQPMTAQNITEVILAQGLYSFNSKDPRSIVRNAIERHCEGVDRRNSASEKLFKKSADRRYALK